MSIDRDLLTAYQNAEYVVFSDDCADQQFVILVNQPSKTLQTLMHEKYCKQAAFITAYNPHSLPLAESQNLVAQTQLTNELHDLGLEFIEGLGKDPQGLWPTEKSLLVFNIDKDKAIQIAHKYAQNAIIWIENDGIPRLLMLDYESR